MIKLICMLFIARHKRETILLTIGDAISSFLEHPDPTTKGRCAMSSWRVEKGQHPWKQAGRWASRHESAKLLHLEPPPSEYPESLPTRGRRLGAVESTHWAATMLL
ncbi:hypothetical protein FE257_008711 [Aspergillus nanangensis]|uniref:Uncharacterized protein n=1 Tax=Aspergillus nanangensis TaxID=2582783 RepID=A0AAD4GUF6_ASPNN|nr:hypothetical protein FE257_008711 [Aspergillus nanangensis]